MRERILWIRLISVQDNKKVSPWTSADSNTYLSMVYSNLMVTFKFRCTK